VALPPMTAATKQKLQGLLDALARWNPAINLVSRTTIPVAWSRHVLDSLQLLDLSPQDATHWVDLGSGGGFPGLVVAIAAMDLRPGLRVTLVEADLRKATFLRETARVLSVSVRVEATRIEALAPQNADIVSARALAPLPQLWTYAERHLAPTGVALFLKGEGHGSESAEAHARFPLSIETLPSRVDAGGVVLRVRRA
jgi:16S rRNA (guanine527-N7)-methyltransferase